ncbi:entericidin A/B family lipoprotein [Litchfieldella xinjiangensis]|nr:entericidin A/B family lipoprotein [Halomonas xinjiangensis]
MRKSIFLSLAVLMTMGLLGGCNTMEGAGEDVESGGEAIQNQAE